MVFAAWTDYIAAAPISFAAGLLVGWVISNRWAIVKRAAPDESRDASHDRD